MRNALLAVVALTSLAIAGEPEPKSLQFRRVFVTDDQQLQAFTKGKPVLPISEQQFQKEIDAARAAVGGSPVNAQITRAVYAARLDGDVLGPAEAALIVMHSGAETVLPLEPCDLAMSRPVWDSLGASDAPARSADVGLGSAGQFLAVVKESGRLRFAWTLRGQREREKDPLSRLQFRPRFPACPVNHLLLALPDGVTPQVDRGDVRRIDSAKLPADWTELRKQLPNFAPLPSDALWQIDLGAFTEPLLTIGRAPQPVANKANGIPAFNARQVSAYRLTDTAAEVNVRLSLDILREPLRELVLDLDPTLHLISVRHGEKSLHWTLVTDDQKNRSAVIEIPDGLTGVARELQIAAVMPLVTGSRWLLPGLRPRSGDWQHGTRTLEIHDPLTLQQIRLSGCEQTKNLPAMDGHSETLELRAFQRTAIVELLLESLRPRVKAQTGVTFDWDDRAVTARLAADLLTDQGETFDVAFLMPPGWTLDAVETAPAEAFDGYAITPSPAGTLVRVRLRRAITARNAVRLKATARRPSPAEGKTLDGELLRFATFQDAVPTRQVAAINVPPQSRARLLRDGRVTYLDPQQLPPAEAALVAPRAGAVTFLADDGLDGVRLTLHRDLPRYSAEIAVTAQVQHGRLDESYRIRCSPQSSPVNRLLVRLMPSRPEPVAWSVDGSPDAIQSATRTDDTMMPRDPSAGEMWEIVLRGERSDDFDLTGRRESAFHERTDVVLATLPEAQTQTATLLVVSPDHTPLTLDNRGLVAIPAEPARPNASTAVRGLFRYEPSLENRLALSFADTPLPKCWVWSCDVVSRFPADGRALHTAVLRIENLGATELTVRLPRVASPQRLEVEEAEIPLTKTAATLIVPLPAGVRFPVVRLTYSSPGAGLISPVSAPLPAATAPMLDMRWTALLAPDLACQSERAEPLAWPRRLFGPLAGSRPFRLFDESDWRSLVGADSDPEPAVKAAVPCLELLGQAELRLLTTAADGTWGELLTRYGQLADAASPSPPPLLIDSRRLAAAGILPTTRLCPGRGATPLARGVSLLRQAGLRIEATNEFVVLSGQNAERDGYLPIVPRRAETNSETVRVNDWIGTPIAGAWSAAGQTPTGRLSDIGWTCHHATIDTATRERGVVTLFAWRESLVRALGWAALLVAAGLVGWRGRQSRLEIAMSVLLAAAIALAVSEPYAPIGSGLFLGAIAGGILGWRRVPEPRVSPELDSTALFPTPAVIGLLLATLFTTGYSVVSRAAEPAKPDPASGKVHEVYILLNDRLGDVTHTLREWPQIKDPRAAVVYVPQEFRSLLEQLGSQSQAKRGWMINSATYQIGLSWETLGSKLRFTEVGALFELEVFEDRQTVRIPFDGQQVLLQQGAKLDGQPVDVEWTANQKAIEIAANHGKYQLEIKFRPRPMKVGGRVGFDVTIPKLPRSLLRALFPSDSRVEFPSAQGAVRYSPEANEALVELGAADRLSVYWPADLRQDAESTGLTAEQLLWLRVQPGSTSLDGLFRFVSDSPLREVRVQLDPRLRLLPQAAAAGENPLDVVETADGDRRFVRLRPKQESNEIAWRPSFLFERHLGIGGLRLPLVEPVADRVARRWLAVTFDSSLEHQDAIGAAKLLAPAKFQMEWGAGDAPPQQAFELTADADWATQIQPLKPAITAEQRLTLAAGLHAVNATLDVAYGGLGPGRFRHRVRTPKACVIASVSVVEDNRETPVEWARDAAGIVTVFLDRRTPGEQTVRLRGSLPWPANRKLTLNEFGAEEATVRSHSVDVYRGEPVQVKVEAPAKWKREPDTIDRYMPGVGRLVGTFRWPDGEFDAAKATLTLTASRNEPHVEGRLVTSLHRGENVWTAEVDCELSVRDGVLDAVRFDLPKSWSKSLVIPAACESQYLPVPGQNRVQLVLRPTRALSGQFAFRISGPLTVAAGDPLRAPDVILLDTSQPAEHFLVVPTREKQQQIQWEASGLQALTREAAGALLADAPETHEAYKVTDPHFQARIKQVRHEQRTAQVYLADVCVTREADGRYAGTVVFDLDPAGLRHCELELADEQQLIAVTVAGLPTTPERITEGHWRVPLGPEALPQRIEVVFRSPRAPRDRYAAPQLVGLDVEHTFWTVRGPEGWRLDAPPLAVDESQQELERMQIVTRLLDKSSDMVAEMAPSELDHWYTPWAEQLRRSHTRTSAEGLRQEHAEPLALVDHNHNAIAERLSILDVKDRVLKSPPRPASADLLLADAAPRSPPARFAFTGSQPSLALRFRSPPRDDSILRLFAALILAATAVSIPLAIRLGFRAEWPTECPQVFGVLCGLAWWLWLQPSLLGWLVIAVSLVSALRLPGRRVVVRTE